MIMDIRNLITFKTIVECNSFTKAALELQYSQSTITTHIKMLEEDLGYPVFDRQGKRFIVNEVGKELYRYTLELLEVYSKIKNISNKDAKTMKGELKIGASETVTIYKLEPVLKTFKQFYPNVKISLINEHCPSLRAKVHEGSIDIALTLEPIVEDNQLAIHMLLEEPIVFIAASNSELTRISKKGNVLEKECIIFSEKGCSLRKSFEKYMKRNGLQPLNTLEFSNMEAIKQCVSSNLGISAVPLLGIKNMLHENKVKVLDTEEPFEAHYIQMVYHKNKWISPALSQFIDITCTHFNDERTLPTI